MKCVSSTPCPCLDLKDHICHNRFLVSQSRLHVPGYEHNDPVELLGRDYGFLELQISQRFHGLSGSPECHVGTGEGRDGTDTDATRVSQLLGHCQQCARGHDHPGALVFRTENWVSALVYMIGKNCAIGNFVFWQHYCVKKITSFIAHSRHPPYGGVQQVHLFLFSRFLAKVDYTMQRSMIRKYSSSLLASRHGFFGPCPSCSPRLWLSSFCRSPTVTLGRRTFFTLSFCSLC